MRIEEDVKLGFKDVLIRPKRATLKSRSDVELARSYTFKHTDHRTGVILQRRLAAAPILSCWTAC
ncbi:hypothetical protein [Pantoea eucrina]|uniref:hypothetical protein n=1 Tax=Pantoea eucrina TaxID=472693 RepID=UPI003A101482